MALNMLSRKPDSGLGNIRASPGSPSRNIDWINNFWKALAHDPAALKRTWEDIKQIMAPGALDPLPHDRVARRGVRPDQQEEVGEEDELPRGGEGGRGSPQGGGEAKTHGNFLQRAA